jgi:hypothetical protein
MHGLWVTIKAAQSVVLLAIVCLLVFMFTRKTDDFILLGMAGVFLFMAALLWANLNPTSREFGLVGIVLSLGFLFLGAQAMTGARGYPRVCTGKRLWCELENALHALGGPALAAAPFLLLGLAALYFSTRFVLRRSLRR